MEIALNTC